MYDLIKLSEIRQTLKEANLDTSEIDERIADINKAASMVTPVSEYLNTFKNGWQDMESYRVDSYNSPIVVWSEYIAGGEIRTVRPCIMTKSRGVEFFSFYSTHDISQSCVAWKPMKEWDGNKCSDQFDTSPYLTREQREVWRKFIVRFRSEIVYRN